MNKWKEVVLEWVNCFDVKRLRTIHDIKKRNFLRVLDEAAPLPSDSNPFEHLLQYLNGHYVSFEGLSDPGNECWLRDDELLLLTSLLLLHASVHCRIEAFNHAASKLDEQMQTSIVAFLQAALKHKDSITKEDLRNAIPADEADTSTLLQVPQSWQGTPTSSSSSPALRMHHNRSSSTPLKSFLSSPIARQHSRQSDVHSKGKVAQLQADLEREQNEISELLTRLEERDATIAELVKKYDVKCDEAKSLEDALTQTAAGEEVQCAAQERGREEGRKLRSEIADLEKYVKQLEEEVGELTDNKKSLQQKLSAYKEKSCDYEARASSHEQMCNHLKAQLQEKTLENEELLAQFSELRQDMTKMREAFHPSPSHLLIGSPTTRSLIASPTPCSQSLGPIIEMQLIDKEKENNELRNEVSQLETQLADLQSKCEEFETNIQREKELAARAQRKFDAKLKELSSSMDSLSKDLSECSKERDQFVVELKKIGGERDHLTEMVKHITAKRDAAILEHTSLVEAKRDLDVKVTQISTKLQLAEEEREEFRKLVTNRASEVVSLTQERDDLASQLKAITKDRDRFEQQITEVTKKRDRIQSIADTTEEEKEALEEQVRTLKQSKKEILMQLEVADNTRKDVEVKIVAILKEKDELKSKLEMLRGNNDELAARLSAARDQIDSANSQVISLTEDNVRLEKERADIAHQKEDIVNEVNKLLLDKEASQKQLTELLAENDNLSSRLSILSQQENDLNENLKVLAKQKKSVERQLSDTLDEKVRVESSLKICQDKLADMSAEKSSLAVDLTSCKQKLECASSKIIDLSQFKEKANSELASLRKSNDKQNDQLLKMIQKLTATESTVSQLKAELDAAHQQSKEQTAMINELEAEKADTEQDLYDGVSRANTLMHEKTVLQTNITSLTEEIKILNDTINKVKEEKCAVDMKLADLEAEIEKVLQQKETTQQNLDVTLKEKDEALLQLAEMAQKNGELEVRLKEVDIIYVEVCTKVEHQQVQIKKLEAENESVKEDFNVKYGMLEEDYDGKIEELSILQQEVRVLESKVKDLTLDNKKMDESMEQFKSKTESLETELANNVSHTEELMQAKSDLTEKLNAVTKARDEMEEWVRSVESDKISLTSKLQTEQNLKEDALCALKDKEMYISKMAVSKSEKDKLLSEIEEKYLQGEREKMQIKEEMNCLWQEKEELCAQLESLKIEIKEREDVMRTSHLDELHAVRRELSEKHVEFESRTKEQMAHIETLKLDGMAKENSIVQLQDKLKEITEERKASYDLLKEEALAKDQLIVEIQHKLKVATEEREAAFGSLQTKEQLIIQVQEQLKEVTEEKNRVDGDIAASVAEMKKEISSLSKEKCDLSRKLQEKEEMIQTLEKEHEKQLCLYNKGKIVSEELESLKTTGEAEKQALVEGKDALERELQEAMKLVSNLKDKIEEQSKAINLLQKELETKTNCVPVESSPKDNMLSVQMELEEAQHKVAQMSLQIQEAKEDLTEEKKNHFKIQEEIKVVCEDHENKVLELQNQVSAARGQGRLQLLQQDDMLWRLDRAKTQLVFKLDEMMAQRDGVEDQLSLLRSIIEEVRVVSDNLIMALPSNCDAVHEVTTMKKEVEKKLRAVDRKYTDSLCGVMTSAYNILKWVEKQTKLTSNDNDIKQSDETFYAERDGIESSVTAVCEIMVTLVADVRAAINSCKFLVERCESYMKAQTRESLKIKPTALVPGKIELSNDSGEIAESNNSPSIKPESYSSEGCMRNESSLTESGADGSTSVPERDWFGGASSLEGGYSLLRTAHAELEKNFSDVTAQLREQLTISEDFQTRIGQLQAEVKVLSLRPTSEQIEEDTKKLHSLYAEKLEGMKNKMKQIVKDEVHKVEQSKLQSEKEITAKFNKRISEFEDHVSHLSSQLWELGDKLLKEQHDRKAAEEQLAALKERQRQFLMSKQRTQSLDRIDTLLQDVDRSTTAVVKPRRQHHSQSALCTQTTQMQSKAKTLPKAQITIDTEEGASMRGTMMAPASMGLAFPEEDEDGQVFNNDYLTELKEGRCRAPLNSSRLSELHYRNSLCPPHLKSSYPLETQFHDPHAFKDEDLMGLEERNRRQGKDRGTTSYKKPGPPTPSRKAGRLSLQGKEDSTPRLALREHNESQVSQGTGTVRVGKTTPSRLRALFTSSKVANVATLPPSKKDENSTPVTPSSKRLSIFRLRKNKETQNANSGYSSLR